jgi:4-hydroxy-tetrahydrodipicolinate synthase
MKRELTGVIPVVPTPFHDDGSLDLESIDRLVRFTAGLGIDALAVLARPDDAFCLTEDERSQIIQAAVSSSTYVPVIVGTASAIAPPVVAAQQAFELGASAVIVAPAAADFGRMDLLLDAMDRIAASVPLPILLQDNGLEPGAYAPVDSMLHLLDEIPAIASVSMSAPSRTRIAALRRGLAHRRATILSGLGALWGLLDLERGVDGFISDFAFPEVLLAVVQEFRSGNQFGARHVFSKHLPLIAFGQQCGGGAQREMLHRRELVTSSHSRDTTAEFGSSHDLADLLAAVLPGEDITRPIDITASRPFLVNI